MEHFEAMKAGLVGITVEYLRENEAASQRAILAAALETLVSAGLPPEAAKAVLFLAFVQYIEEFKHER